MEFCSVLSEQAKVQVIGSVAPHRRIMTFSLPIEQWGREVTDSSFFSDQTRTLLKQHKEIKFIGVDQPKKQGNHPIEASEKLQIDVYTKDDSTDLSTPLRQESYAIPPVEIDAFLSDFLAGNSPDPSHINTTPDTTRRLGVCVHGKRDACCAKFGRGAAKTLRETSSSLGTNTRLEEISHTAGHRLSAVVLDLPFGDNWGFMHQATPEVLASILTHTGATDILRNHYRGRMSLPPSQQVAHGEVLFQRGWDEFDSLKTIHEQPTADPDVSLVTLQGKHTYQATIRRGAERSVPVGCPHPGDTPHSAKFDRIREYTLVTFTII